MEKFSLSGSPLSPLRAIPCALSHSLRLDSCSGAGSPCLSSGIDSLDLSECFNLWHSRGGDAPDLCSWGRGVAAAHLSSSRGGRKECVRSVLKCSWHEVVDGRGDLMKTS